MIEAAVRADLSAKLQIERQNMKLKKLGMAFVVVCALGVVMASSAFAAATTTDVKWYTGASPGTELNGSETVASEGRGELFTTVGETPLVLDAAGIECIECRIENSGGTAVGSGKLKFTGVTVAEPSTCAVSGGAVTTLALKIKADYMIGETDYVLFEPNSGTTFATVTLTAGSGSCPLAGNYIVSGTEFVKAENKTGVQALSQKVLASGTINSEAGGALKFGSKPASLVGSGTFFMSGSKKGVAFGTH